MTNPSNPPHLKVAVITDGGRIPRFALLALDAVEGTDEITLVNCTNTRTRNRWLKHGLYYALNLLSVRNPLTRLVHAGSGQKRVARELVFQSEYDGTWQVLPPGVIRVLRDADVILKFGMGLLRVPPQHDLAVPILSYHHGDPDRYRGRPAGFWEIVHAQPLMGQMLQIISNRLDAGHVVAFAETKVLPWSWRRTLVESFRHSPLIINTAIRNALSGTSIPKPCSGRNFRLPSNLRVAVFILRMAASFLRRIAYGLWVEKAWNVSTITTAADGPPMLLRGEFPRESEWQTLPIAKGYDFYADPFFTREPPGILLEALGSRSGIGEIVLVTDECTRTISSGGGHMSYPAAIEIRGREYIIPEIAGWSPPLVHEINGGALQPLFKLQIEGDPRLLDPTLLEWNGRFYLFGNDKEVGSNALHLWCSTTLAGLYRAHPASPVRISPRGGRMGGNFVELDGRLFRFGQDYTRGYGDGLIVFQVTALEPHMYAEREFACLKFNERKGPHTLNIRDGEMVFDWYYDRVAPLAGIRRVARSLAAGPLASLLQTSKSE